MEELRERLEASEARVRQLEEELDLLAFDNERLRAEIKQLKESNDHSPKQSSQPEKSIQEVQTKIIVVEGDNKYPNKIRRRFDNVCSGSNVIAVKYVSIAGREAILCGGADRSVRCFDSATGSPYCSFFMPGPVLSLAAAPCPADNSGSSSGRSGLLVLVAAAMDGSVVIVSGSRPCVDSIISFCNLFINIILYCFLRRVCPGARRSSIIGPRRCISTASTWWTPASPSTARSSPRPRTTNP